MKHLFKTLLICLSVFLCFMGVADVPTHAGDINTLNVAVYHSRISTLDPHVQNSTERYICFMTYEPLIARFKDTVKLVPVLATSWKVSEDAKTFTFFLRKGVKFHDGTEFDAEAVKFNFDRITALKKGFYWMLSRLDKVEVLDKHTVRFQLKESFSPFLTMVEYFPMVSPKSVLEHEEQKGDYAQKWYIDHGIGTGPYRFIEWQHGVKVVHEKYDGYWGDWSKNHCSRVINWIIPEAATQRMMLEKGELDVIQNFTIDDFNQLKKVKGLVTLENDSMAPQYVRFNNVAGPTKKLKIRQAISYCFDRKLYESLSGGRIQYPDGPCPKELLGGWRPDNVITEYNPEKAKKLLEEAGYQNGFEMSMLVQKGSPSMKTVAEIWQSGLSKAGIKLNIQILPWPALATRLNNWAVDRNPATAENSYICFLSPRMPDPYSYLYLAYHTNAQTGKGRNWMLYSNPEVDALTAKAVITTDPKERLKIYKKAVQMVANDTPDLFVDKMIDRVVMRDVVKGFYFDALYVHAVPYFSLYKTSP